MALPVVLYTYQCGHIPKSVYVIALVIGIACFNQILHRLMTRVISQLLVRIIFIKSSSTSDYLPAF